jgi:hypothetical protein
MTTAAKESLCGLTDEHAIGIEKVYFAHDFVGSVFTRGYRDVRIFSHERILTYNLTENLALASDNVTFGCRNFNSKALEVLGCGIKVCRLAFKIQDHPAHVLLNIGPADIGDHLKLLAHRVNDRCGDGFWAKGQL